MPFSSNISLAPNQRCKIQQNMTPYLQANYTEEYNESLKYSWKCKLRKKKHALQCFCTKIKFILISFIHKIYIIISSEQQKERPQTFICWFTSPSPTVCICPGLSMKARNKISWVVGKQRHEPSSLPLRVCSSKKLDSEVRTDVRLSNTKHIHLNSYTKHLLPYKILEGSWMSWL